MARTFAYKRKAGTIALTPQTDPINNPGQEATQIPLEGVRPETKIVVPGSRISTTMEIRSQIADIMNARNYHPIRELVDMVQAVRQKTDAAGNKLVDERGQPLYEHVYDAEFRKSVHAELAPYIAPKLKAIDMQVQGKMSISVKVIKFSEVAQRKVDAAKPAERVIDV